MLVTLNAFPVEETEAEMLESVILFVETLAVVKIVLPFIVAVPLIDKLVFTIVPPFKVTPPPKVAPLETLRPWLKVPVDPLTVNPFEKVPNPELLTVNKVLPPLFKVKLVPPVDTEAETFPVAILDKFNPEIAEAGILVSPAPEPENVRADKDPEISTDPENLAGPILIKVFEPDTVKDPVITTLPEKAVDPVTDILPETLKKGVAKNPEFASTVPLSPGTP